MDNIFQTEYFDNSILDYSIALGIIMVGFTIARLLKRTILKRFQALAEKTLSTGDNFIVESIDKFGLPALYYFIVYTSVHYLDLSVKVERVITVATAVVITFFALRLISTTILFLLRHYIKRQHRGEEKVKQLGGVMLLINIFVWVVGVVFLVDNLGYNVTTIITGLGIGGIAIALAAQNILGDLFNYFVIFFDRPFEVDDFIIVDDKMGTIEYIGIKTTRIRSLSGEQIIIGNSNLTAARIHNYKRLADRRVVFTLNIDYRTQPSKLKVVSQVIRSVIESQPLTRFDRANFSAYGDWSLRYEVVYYFVDPDFNKFMNTQEDINVLIYEELLKREIYFVTAFNMSLAPTPPTNDEPENNEIGDRAEA